ncbi:MAG: DUF362 domain-containing protein [Candidatus Latescibacteria bacterium]|jgi:uncharacterized protein (DUF362 family)|nr:DUF362 domain-containing protein [Candidatus Latescibacterota bacterium]
MKTDRRDFLKAASGLLTGLPLLAQCAQIKSDRAAGNKPLLYAKKYSIEAAMKRADAGKKGNIPPVIREEILDNPNAVFIIRTQVQSQKKDDGSFPNEKEQMERAGFDAGSKLFRKGGGSGGKTYIKPNFVHFVHHGRDTVNNGISTHPWFVAGFCEALKDCGNTNIIVGANGGSKHTDFDQAGICDLMDNRGIIFLEGKYPDFNEYSKREVTWFDYQDGVVMKKVPFFTPVVDDDTTFINMAKTRIHNLAVTTLTIKNLQGIMPVGYMHICGGWPTGLKPVVDIKPDEEIINPDYQKLVEKGYIKHAGLGYKYYDDGGFAKEYFDAGGWEAFKNGNFKPNFLTFREEQWSQRMLDIADSLDPHVNIVEGVFGIDIKDNLYLNNFITVSRSMVACDAVTSWMMGHDPRELFYLRIANERSMGENDIEKIPLFEITGSSVRKLNDYRKLPRARMGVVMHLLKNGKLRYF